MVVENNKEESLGAESRSSCRLSSSSLILYLSVIGILLIVINCRNLSTWQSPLFNKAVSQNPLLPLMKNHTKSNNINNTISALQCLDLNLNQELDSMISRARQIYVTMPSKAGGSSMNNFTIRCGHTCEASDGLPFRFIEKNKYEDLLDKPRRNSSSIISSHISRDTSLIHLARRRSNEKVLIIYIHRGEDERTISGIKMIAHHMCKKKVKVVNNFMMVRYTQSAIAKNETHCIIDEESMGKFIAQGHRELDGGSSSILTCSLYNALQFNHPEFVFLHYKQVDKLQTLLAKHHCPELLDELPIRKNIAAEKVRKIFLHKRKGDANNETSIEEILGEEGVVQIEDWLDAKGSVLEGALASLSEIKEEIASCQKETSQMQSKLFGCADEALKLNYA